MSKRAFVRLCFVPLAVLVTAFFVLPMARLVLVGASGDQGLRAYAAILLDPLVVGNCILKKDTQDQTLKRDYSSAFDPD
jgi:hypothetical protein